MTVSDISMYNQTKKKNEKDMQNISRHKLKHLDLEYSRNFFKQFQTINSDNLTNIFKQFLCLISVVRHCLDAEAIFPVYKPISIVKVNKIN